ncbi:hypothetical protein FRC18_007102 [Serendipita sp. 400]|nr:hypothetical protein FRC18_007102 [Serendipita sp. 400]
MGRAGHMIQQQQHWSISVCVIANYFSCRYTTKKKEKRGEVGEGIQGRLLLACQFEKANNNNRSSIVIVIIIIARDIKQNNWEQCSLFPSFVGRSQGLVKGKQEVSSM